MFSFSLALRHERQMSVAYLQDGENLLLGKGPRFPEHRSAMQARLVYIVADTVSDGGNVFLQLIAGNLKVKEGRKKQKREEY